MTITAAGLRRPLDVTLTEFRLLSFMARQPSRVFTRADLLDACLTGDNVLERTIDSHLSKLRKKLADKDGAFLPIEYAAMVVFGACSVVLAAGAARSLSRRLVAPITAVAAAARCISAGEQSARANVETTTPTELVGLAEVFNAMAERLQLAADEERFWNAAIAHELRTPVTVLRGRLQGASSA